MSEPAVSIVTATWNRSNVLRFTIESVLAQTMSDWELIVVGDGCTDDTGDVVRSFSDPRIRFVNLEANSGDQATPNNEGVRLARGATIAFLNHDDLWLPDHLATACEELQRRGADLVWELTLGIEADGSMHLLGCAPEGSYRPQVQVPASSWMLRRELAEAVGPWRPAREIFCQPSQEWLHRASKRGHRLQCIPRPGVVAVMSGRRAGSYAERHESENARYAARLREDPEALVAELMAAVARREAEEHARMRVLRPLARTVKNAISRAAIAVGMHPMSLRTALVHRRRGGFIEFLRKMRGLPPLPRKGERNG